MIKLKKKSITNTRIFWNCTKKKSWRDILRLEISFFNIIIKYSADQWTSNPYNHFIMTAREISFENAAAFNRKKRRRRKRLSYIYIYLHVDIINCSTTDWTGGRRRGGRRRWRKGDKLFALFGFARTANLLQLQSTGWFLHIYV